MEEENKILIKSTNKRLPKQNKNWSVWNGLGS